MSIDDTRQRVSLLSVAYDPDMASRLEARDDDIIRTVMRLLETEGFEAVQVRRVADEASISLATLYKLYGSRDELIIRAIERWMRENAYVGLDDIPDDATPFEAASKLVRTVFARWEQQPHMLAAFTRARLSPGGKRLDAQGFTAVMPRAQAALAGLDPDLLADTIVILEHVNLAAIQRFADGEIAVTEIVPLYERALRRLLPDERPPERPTPKHRSRHAR